jgi:hypothetical protein
MPRRAAIAPKRLHSISSILQPNSPGVAPASGSLAFAHTRETVLFGSFARSTPPETHGGTLLAIRMNPTVPLRPRCR